MFQPVLPQTGLNGWRFLHRTYETQRQAFDKSAQISREANYFSEKIGGVTTAEELVSDPKLLKVALTAYGLEADLSAKAFVRKVLEDGAIDPSALANKLSDSRYKAFTQAFGFGDFSTPNTKLSTFAETTLEKFRSRAFEAAVGEQDQNLRLALNAKRELASIAGRSQSENTKWYAILGAPPLRAVVEKALGLPESIRSLDLDRQLGDFKDRASKFGISSLSDLADEAKLDQVVEAFLVRSEVETMNAGVSGAQVAIQLLASLPSMQSRFSFYQ